MHYFDVFNGDADGICALQQLRLHNPIESTLITGVKRDIALLKQVNATKGDHVTTLDISLDKNRDALLALLDKGVTVLYFDHHYAGEIPEQQGLEAHINTDKKVCSSLLVDQYLNGAHRLWAITAAFGDNLHQSAMDTAADLDLSETQLEQLRNLGTYINYNGYGSNIEDLYFHPADLYKRLHPYANPFDFIREDESFSILENGFNSDMTNARKVSAEASSDKTATYILPDAAWARRVSGVYANELARENPERAHALATLKPGGGYVISVRAPIAINTGADELCRQFPTGGGRQGAAGINHLEEADMDKFIQAFQKAYDG